MTKSTERFRTPILPRIYAGYTLRDGRLDARTWDARKPSPNDAVADVYVQGTRAELRAALNELDAAGVSCLRDIAEAAEAAKETK